MQKRDRPNDGMVPKLIISAIVVIWVSLVGGNWLGHYAVEKGLLLEKKGKGKKGAPVSNEYRPQVAAKPKPWVTVDPRQVEEVERLSGQTQSIPVNTGGSPEPAATPDEVVTSTPVDVIDGGSSAPTPTPASAETPDDGAPKPTPAGGADRYQLQFGSFNQAENAQAMADQLKAKGQQATVEEIQAGNGKVFRVRGGSYSEEEARQQRDKLKEQNIDAYMVKEQ